MPKTIKYGEEFIDFVAIENMFPVIPHKEKTADWSNTFLDYLKDDGFSLY